jgi:hypothetical protein
MTSEIWMAVAALLVGVAALAGVLFLLKLRSRWAWIVTVARAASIVALAVALILAAFEQGEWSPFDPRQAIPGLILATLALHMILAWRRKAGSAGPVVDLFALVLILVGAFAIEPGASPLNCAQRTFPFRVQWILFLVGGGGVLVAGNAGLLLALRRLVETQEWALRLPDPSRTWSLLVDAVYLALVALGSGLTVSLWWSWRTVGELNEGDPRVGWVGIAWLTSSMSLVAWQLESRREQWAAGLAVVAAAAVLFGLLVAPELWHLTA